MARKAPTAPDVATLEPIARAALHEITPDASVGELVGEPEGGEGLVTLRFASTQSGYPDWFWTVALSQVEGLEPTVLETELMPGDGALLAPDWVPWAVRLEEYRAAQAEAGEPDETQSLDEAGDDSDEHQDDADDVDDLDEHDLHDDEDDAIDEQVDEHEVDDDPEGEPEPAAAPVESASAAVVPPGEGEQQEPAAQTGDDHPERRRVGRRPGRRAQG
ncbi:MAG: DUF3027 domain-containing protein [Actinomycetales bacterium]|nr:DUF3027 domain-containing protein [Actinomycetales bacterium]